MNKSDTDLHSDVFDELDFDPALDSSLITTTVNHGSVTLSGEVPTYWQNHAPRMTPGASAEFARLRITSWLRSPRCIVVATTTSRLRRDPRWRGTAIYRIRSGSP